MQKLARTGGGGAFEEISAERLIIAACQRCHRLTVWVGGRLVHPDASDAPRPNPDLPDDISIGYEETASIVNRSPRGAAASLRLCIQKLCKVLGKKGSKIESDLRDNTETAVQLFGLVNFIADNRISEPKRIQEIYDSLPESKRKGIEARDRGAVPPAG